MGSTRLVRWELTHGIGGEAVFTDVSDEFFEGMQMAFWLQLPYPVPGITAMESVLLTRVAETIEPGVPAAVLEATVFGDTKRSWLAGTERRTVTIEFVEAE